MMKLLSINHIFNQSFNFGKNSFLILIFCLTFFFISSIIALSYSKKIISLRFISEDFVQILDHSTKNILTPHTFYQSENIIVYNTMNDQIEHLIENISTNKGLEKYSSVQIVFSDKKIKENFFRLITTLNSEDLKNQDLKKLIMAQSKSMISPGEICYLNSCITNFIAFKNNTFKGNY